MYFSRLGLGVFNAQRLTPGSCFGGKGFGGGRKTSDENMESSRVTVSKLSMTHRGVKVNR